MEFSHKSVLLREAINLLNINPDGIYVDGTAGGAGHSKEIAKKLTNGKLYALDRDPDAVKVATERLAPYNAQVIEANFHDMQQVLSSVGVNKVNGILLDLGVSSYQLDTAERGFSYHKDAPLDMRMSKSGVSAADLVNTLDANTLAKIFTDYGEEKFAYKIACGIVKARQNKPIKTTFQLADIIAENVPAFAKRNGHPARKCFQALRIEVNGELDFLKKSLLSAFALLEKGGVLGVITFHSLEDRIVKQTFNELTIGCTCPKDFPVCVCGKKPLGKLASRKPIIPSEEEIAENQRSRSAKLRGITKLREGYFDE